MFYGTGIGNFNIIKLENQKYRKYQTNTIQCVCACVHVCVCVCIISRSSKFDGVRDMYIGIHQYKLLPNHLCSEISQNN